MRFLVHHVRDDASVTHLPQNNARLHIVKLTINMKEEGIWESVDWRTFDEQTSSLPKLYGMALVFSNSDDMQSFKDTCILDQLSQLRLKLGEGRLTCTEMDKWEGP